LFVTILLALWLRSYWALVIGTIAVHFSNAVILTVKSNWRPRLFYDALYLKKMFSFCSWTVLDTILVWATSYIDVFLIAVMLNEYYLGLYKTSIATVGQIVSIITAGILPVLMPSLSRVQNDFSEMRVLLLKFQKYMAIILLPLGVGIFMFSDLITAILLGEQWKEASNFIGLWGLMEVVTIIFARFCSVIYPAIGKPRISVLVQILHLVVLIPAVYIAVQYGFTALYWTRSLVRLEGVLVNIMFAYMLIQQSPWKMLKNILPEAFSAVVMGLVAYLLLSISNSILMSFVYIPICIVVYFGLLYIIPYERNIMMAIKDKIFNKNNKF
jgi:PST family polysaccharide transporter